jgi:hypothetical protein
VTAGAGTHLRRPLSDSEEAKSCPAAMNFFTIVDGKISNAELHEEILASGDHDAATSIGRAQAKKVGLTEEELDLLYGRSTAFDPKE